MHHDGFADDSRIIPPYVPDRRCRLKGVAPKHVTLNQIFAGMMPYMIIVLICLVFSLARHDAVAAGVFVR